MSWLGFVLAVVSPILMGSGGVMQKRGLMNLPDLPPDWWIEGGKIRWAKIKEVGLKLLNFHFIFGSIIALGGWLLYLWALSLTDISIVQPLQGLGNLMPLTLGVLWLHERISRRELFFVLLLIAGVIGLGAGT